MTYFKKWHMRGLVGCTCLALLIACGGGEPEKKDEMKDTVAAQTVHPQADESDISYVLPSPLQVADIFKKAGLKYYAGIGNSTEAAAKYRSGSLVARALNMGVYGADLSYCVLNKQSQESKNYFKVCKDMAGELGLAKAFEINNVGQRLEKNLANYDSLAAILVDIQMETDNILSENNQEHVSVISFAGAWIESMYIAIQVHMKEKNVAIANELVQQMAIADNIIKALKAHASKDPAIDGLVVQLKSLSDIYLGFKSVKEVMATDPDVIDASKLNISLVELYSFAKRLEEIRTTIIK